jgi:hypothetical protein
VGASCDLVRQCSWCTKGAADLFYDEKALVMHYTKNHFMCHICDRLNVRNKWFKDYAGLDSHFFKVEIRVIS